MGRTFSALDRSPASSPGVKTPGYYGTRLSALVLDADAPLRNRLGRALEQRGFEPTLVGSVAEAIVSGFGVTVAPRIDAVSVYGADAVSDVRRASTTTSHTPACGFDTVLLEGLPGQPAASGGL